jgi:hypothetical protein
MREERELSPDAPFWIFAAALISFFLWFIFFSGELL